MGFFELLNELKQEFDELSAELNGQNQRPPAADFRYSREAVRRPMTDEERARLAYLKERQAERIAEADRELDDDVQGSIENFTETENIEFHKDGHSSPQSSTADNIALLTDKVKPVGGSASRFTPSDARRGFIMSEILGKPLALRGRRR